MEDAQLLKELYEIVKQNHSGDYADVIQKKASYPYLYHLSGIRQNLIDWLPITGEMRVLERNAECGALTGRLLEMAGEVCSVTDDEAHAAIIRARCGEERCGGEDGGTTARHTLHVYSQMEQIHGRFDMIVIVGKTWRFREELLRLRELLTENGSLILGDANRLGLKYFAGCQEEYRGGYFTGISGYDTVDEAAVRTAGTGEGDTAYGYAADEADVRCCSRAEYERMLRRAGFEELTFYYPYPDHKFPSAIYSDEWLPHRGELAQNRRNFDRDRIECFDEGRVYDALLQEGVFGSFSNSFLIEAR